MKRNVPKVYSHVTYGRGHLFVCHAVKNSLCNAGLSGHIVNTKPESPERVLCQEASFSNNVCSLRKSLSLARWRKFLKAVDCFWSSERLSLNPLIGRTACSKNLLNHKEYVTSQCHVLHCSGFVLSCKYEGIHNPESLYQRKVKFIVPNIILPVAGHTFLHDVNFVFSENFMIAIMQTYNCMFPHYLVWKNVLTFLTLVFGFFYTEPAASRVESKYTIRFSTTFTKVEHFHIVDIQYRLVSFFLNSDMASKFSSSVWRTRTIKFHISALQICFILDEKVYASCSGCRKYAGNHQRCSGELYRYIRI